MSGVAHTDYRRVMDAADANGWEPEDESGTVGLSLRLTRGDEWVRVLFDSHGTAELASTSAAGRQEPRAFTVTRSTYTGREGWPTSSRYSPENQAANEPRTAQSFARKGE
jgi:hypothetical protein